MLRDLFRILGALSTARAASRGPGALGRRVARRKAHRTLSRALRARGL